MLTVLIAIAVFIVFFGIGILLIKLPKISSIFIHKDIGFTQEEMEQTKQQMKKRMVKNPDAYKKREYHLQ